MWIVKTMNNETDCTEKLWRNITTVNNKSASSLLPDLLDTALYLIDIELKTNPCLLFKKMEWQLIEGQNGHLKYKLIRHLIWIKYTRCLKKEFTLDAHFCWKSTQSRQCKQYFTLVPDTEWAINHNHNYQSTLITLMF